jgi:hypothetical protein
MIVIVEVRVCEKYFEKVFWKSILKILFYFVFEILYKKYFILLFSKYFQKVFLFGIFKILLKSILHNTASHRSIRSSSFFTLNRPSFIYDMNIPNRSFYNFAPVFLWISILSHIRHATHHYSPSHTSGSCISYLFTFLVFK